jgi:nucleoid DNA-binding protein
MMTRQMIQQQKYGKPKQLTSTDIYMQYPYKKWIQNTIGITKPYIKKKDRTSTPFSLTYKEWYAIIDTYTKKIAAHLVDGGIIKIPCLGEIRVGKRAAKPKIDWVKTKKIYGTQKGKKKSDIKLIRFKQMRWDGMRYFLHWDKSFNRRVKNLSYMTIKPLQAFRTLMSDALNSNPGHIYNYPTPKHAIKDEQIHRT